MVNFDFSEMKGGKKYLVKYEYGYPILARLHRFACARTMPIKGFRLVKRYTTGW